MNTNHLSQEQWAALLAGEEDAAAAAHLAACAACREELAAWQEGLAALGRWEPDPWTRTRVREQALDRAFPVRRRVWWWAVLPAAAALLAALVLRPWRPAPVAEADLAAVLQEVDATLSQDPLAALADPEVVSVVLPEPQPSQDAGRS